MTACECNVTGSQLSSDGGPLSCNPSTGQCLCKRYVHGLHCDQCIDGYWNLQSTNVDGCQRSYISLFTSSYRPAVCPVQGRKHVLGGPVHWSRVLLPFYRKKFNRFTQFGAVGYIITFYSSKSYVKSTGVRSNFGEVRTPTDTFTGCAHGPVL